MVILGIDPGLERIGWGVVRRTGSRLECLALGCVTTPRIAVPDRLAIVAEDVERLILDHRPVALATERPFFAANRTTAFDVAKALGVVLLLGARHGLEWAEYTPAEVKKAVTGNGAAEKAQVSFMVRRLLALEADPRPDDVADALAIAIAHAFAGRIAALGAERR